MPTFKNEVDKFPPEILAGIGRIVAEWGYLQHQLGVVAREAAGLKDKAIGRALMVRLDISDLCRMILALSYSARLSASPQLAADMQRLAKAVMADSAVRNDYAHGVFLRGDTGEVTRALIKSSQDRLEPREEPVTPESLAKVAGKARALFDLAQSVTDRLKRP